MSHTVKINVANPHERSFERQSYLFCFGAYGSTYVLAYGGLEDALESAAEWLADNAPGHIIGHGSDHAKDLWREACAEVGIDPDDSDADDDLKCKAFEIAESDLTHTESGYLTSHEWAIVAENPSKATLIAIAKGR